MKYKIRNVGKAATAGATSTGKILVQFPYMERRVGKNIVTKAPRVFLKPRVKGRDAFVRFDNRVWKIAAEAWYLVEDLITRKPMHESDGRLCKAVIFFDVDYEAEPTPA